MVSFQVSKILNPGDVIYVDEFQLEVGRESAESKVKESAESRLIFKPNWYLMANSKTYLAKLTVFQILVIQMSKNPTGFVKN